ncbi:hypothetical protein MUK42_35529 [Musa troglodytarum]|nr:hypothetical protein MUK42_35529 [Musa troglodytarum]
MLPPADFHLFCTTLRVLQKPDDDEDVVRSLSPHSEPSCDPVTGLLGSFVDDLAGCFSIWISGEKGMRSGADVHEPVKSLQAMETGLRCISITPRRGYMYEERVFRVVVVAA